MDQEKDKLLQSRDLAEEETLDLRLLRVLCQEGNSRLFRSGSPERRLEKNPFDSGKILLYSGKKESAVL